MANLPTGLYLLVKCRLTGLLAPRTRIPCPPICWGRSSRNAGEEYGEPGIFGDLNSFRAILGLDLETLPIQVDINHLSDGNGFYEIIPISCTRRLTTLFG